MEEQLPLYNENNDDNNDIIYRIKLVGFSKNIKFYSIVDMFYILYISFFKKWFYIFTIITPIIGYFGAIKYNNKIILLYLILSSIDLILKLYFLMNESSVFNILISSIMLIISIIYINTIKRFYFSLKDCKDKDLEQLKLGWKPRYIKFVF